MENKLNTLQSYLSDSFYKRTELENKHTLLNLHSIGSLSSIDDAWNLYAGSMKTLIGGTADMPNLQLVSLAGIEEKLNWDDSDFGDYYFHKVTCDLINTNGASYNKTDKSFSERYGLFIKDLQVPPVDLGALTKAIEAKNLLDSDETRHKELYDNLNLEWQAFDIRQRNNLPPICWVSFDDWWNNIAEDLYQRSREIVLAYYQNYKNWLQKAYNGGESISKILNAYDYTKKLKVKKPSASSSSHVGGIEEIYPYQISEDYKSWLNAAKNGQLARTQLTIKKDSYRSDVSQTDIGGGIGVGFGFFGALAFGQRRTLQIDTTSENFEMNFDGVFKMFNLFQSDWYNSSAFDLFRNGPFFPNSPMENLNRSNAIFGAKGFLSFKPARALVVFNPKLTMKFDRNIYHYFEQETSGFAGFCIGPFVIGGGSYYDHSISVTQDSDNFSFSFEIKNYAILIGSDNQEL